jgi:WD40 repeat protein
MGIVGILHCRRETVSLNTNNALPPLPPVLPHSRTQSMDDGGAHVEDVPIAPGNGAVVGSVVAATQTRTHVFICYRRNDGDWFADWLHQTLNGLTYTDTGGAVHRLVTYYDKQAPGVADWTKLHFPSLRTSHALLLVCTPGIATDFSKRGRPDWVYEELRWWRKYRRSAPIVVDTTGEGERWLPKIISKKWPNLNRIALSKSDVERAVTSGDADFTARLRERIVATVRESEHATVFEDLVRFRKLNRRLGLSLAGVLILLGAVFVTLLLALDYNRAAQRARRVALSRQLSAQSEVVRRSGNGSLDEVGALLTVEALKAADTIESDQAARNALQLLPSSIIGLPLSANPGNRLLTVNSLASRIVTISNPLTDNINSVSAEVIVWDAIKGARVVQFSVAGVVTNVAITPDGSMLATGSKDGTVIVRNASNGAEKFRMHFGKPIRTLVFDARGEQLAIGGAKAEVIVAKIADGSVVARLPSDAPVIVVAFSPSGQQLAIGTAPTPQQAQGSEYFLYAGSHDPTKLGPIQTAHIFDLATQRERHGLTHEGTVFALDYSKDGDYLATGSWDGMTRIWDTQTGALFSQFAYPSDSPITSVSFSPDPNSSLLAIAGANDKVTVWDWRRNKQYGQLTHPGVTKAIFSPDGLRLASIGGRTARLWDYIKRIELTRFVHDIDVSQVFFVRNGNSLVSTGTSERSAWIWSANAGAETWGASHQGSIQAATYSPDGTRVVTGSFDGYTSVWDARTGANLFKFLHAAKVSAVALDAKGSRFASGGGMGNDSGYVDVRDLSTFRPVFERDFKSRVHSVALNSDGTRLAAGFEDGTARAWQLDTGEELSRITHGENMAVRAVAFSPDDRSVASGGVDGTVRIWDVSNGKENQRFEHKSAVLAVDFSRDGRFIASGTLVGEARVWNLSTGKQLIALMHPEGVTSLKFSSHADLIVTGSEDSTARIWNRVTGEPIVVLLQPARVNAVLFSPGDRLFLVAGSDGLARAFPVSAQDLIAQLCARLTRNLSDAEWREYLHDTPYSKSCPDLAVPADAYGANVKGDRRPSEALTGKVAEFILQSDEVSSSPGDPLRSLATRGAELALNGKIPEALATFSQITTLGSDNTPKVSAQQWNLLCWEGSLHGFAKDVLFACDNAIATALQGGQKSSAQEYMDSRAVARALTGNVGGAIADLEAFLSWCKQDADCAEASQRRERWLDQLRRGENPFDFQTMEALRNEGAVGKRH